MTIIQYREILTLLQVVLATISDHNFNQSHNLDSEIFDRIENLKKEPNYEKVCKLLEEDICKIKS